MWPDCEREEMHTECGVETSFKTATWKTEEMKRKHILGKWVLRM
jgi:hypothetical protein